MNRSQWLNVRMSENEYQALRRLVALASCTVVDKKHRHHYSDDLKVADKVLFKIGRAMKEGS